MSAAPGRTIATITIDITELQDVLAAQAEQEALLLFLKTSDFVETAESPEVVLRALAEQIVYKNHIVLEWLMAVNDQAEAVTAPALKAAHIEPEAAF